MQVPGRHNVLNALAAITIADQLDIKREVTLKAIAEFTGVHRRFEVKGEVNGVLVVDDYAHHPTEVENTLRTARLGWPNRRIVALFQPHLFTRHARLCGRIWQGTQFSRLDFADGHLSVSRKADSRNHFGSDRKSHSTAWRKVRSTAL